MNTKEIAPQQRFKVLELFRGPIQYLSDALKRHFVGASFPLSVKANRAASLLYGLHQETTKGYQCITDELLSVDNLRQDFVLLTASLHRALYYHGESLLTTYQVYRPVARGLWSNIHQTYQAAERKGLQASTVKDPHQPRNRETTIEAQYKQILLLAMANPNHLPQADIALVYAHLAHWATQCRLYPAVHFDEPRSDSIVNLESDSPPSYVEYCRDPQYSACRLLDTSGLIHVLRRLLPQSTPEIPKPSPESGGQWTPELRKELLLNLIKAWGATSKRGFSRSKGDLETVELVFGLSTSHHILNDLSPMAGETAGTISFNQRQASRSDGKGAASKSRSTANIAMVYHCEILNESADGACLKWKNADVSKVRVGELLTIRRNPNDKHLHGIAVVRWLKTLNDNTVEFGIQLIVPEAVPAAIRHYDEEDSEREYLKILYLPELKAIRQPASLIVPAFLYRADDIVSLKMDQDEHHLQLEKVIESNPIFSRFQFSTVT